MSAKHVLVDGLLRKVRTLKHYFWRLA